MTCRRGITAAALAACAALASGQQQTLSQFFEAVEVRVLDLDVVVLDRDGAPVRGLTREDFTLLEDGREVELTHFAEHDETATVPSGVAPAVEGAAPAVAAPAPTPTPGDGVTWLVYLDQSRLRPSRRNQVVEQVRRFLGGALRPGDRTMVATWDGDALHLASPLSTDPEWPLAALEAVARQPAARASSLSEQASSLRHDINSASPLSINTVSDKQENRERTDFNQNETRPHTAVQAENLLRRIESLGEEENRRTRASIAGLRDLTALTEGIEGRVGVLVVGAGFDSDPVDNLYRMWESRFRNLDVGARAGRTGARATEVTDEYGRLLGSLRTTRTTVFAVDAGEDVGHGVSEVAGAGQMLAGTSAAQNASGESRSSLAGLAEVTGGRLFVGGPNLADALGDARRYLVTFYALGYRPSDASDERVRRVEVRVRVPGARVVHRPEIALRSAGQDASAAAVAVLLARPDAATPVPPSLLVIETGDPRRPERGRGFVLPVTVRVPLEVLTLVPDGAAHHGRIAFFLAVERPDGGFARLEPRQLAFDVPTAGLEQALGQTVNYRLEVAFGDSGTHRLAVAVVDEPSGERWTGVTAIEIGGGGG